MVLRKASLLAVTTLLFASAACGDEGSPESGAVGTGDTGGAAMGGAVSGGAASGGVAVGGMATGGFAAGGAATGGVATGGMATGGFATGGAATGGTATGGAATGGAATGGAATGGAATGGADTGGFGTGGVPSGGVPSGGAATGGAPTGGVPTGGSGGATCVDEPPPNGDTCAHAVEWDWCGAPWMAGACALSCGLCAGSTGGAGGTGGSGGTTGGGGSGGTTGGGGSGGTTGGNSGTGGTTGGTGGASGGTGGASGGTGGASTGEVFNQCRFHFGAGDWDARDNANIRDQIDYFIPGWMLGGSFDQQYVCDEADDELTGKIPAVVTYVAAGIAKRDHNPPLDDCNVGSTNLCVYGAAFISQNLDTILNAYRSYSQGYANCYGTTRPIIFMMEPDFYQYTYDSQTDPWTPAEAGQIMSQFVAALGQSLPNAIFSMDISPWVGPSNGSDNGAWWYSYFDMSLFTFIHTSGGGTDAANTRIRSSNQMTWGGVHGVTGKPILADTGYGVNGSSAGHDAAWDSATNINARIANGVVGIAQYNPVDNWGTTIANIRGQLAAPTSCP